MHRRYKIVHLITRLELGGAQQNTLFCVEHHDRSRFDVELLAGDGGLLDDDARAIPDADVHLVPWLKHPIAPGFDLVALVRLVRYLRASGADVVHTHSSKAGLLGRVAAFLAGVPAVVHTAHGWSFNPSQATGVRGAFVALERLAASLCDRLITVSRHDREEGVRLGIGRQHQYATIHSGIEVSEFARPRTDPRETRAALGIEPDQWLVGTVACLKPQKAPLDFVRAAAIAHARDDRLRFIVAGDGELRAEVDRLVEELGLGGIVQPLGWRRDVADLLHAMDVFLLTSRFEGLPRAVLQALAAGVPVVATAVDGTPEVIEHRRTGLLVPPGEPGRAAEALLEFVADPVLRQGCASRGRQLLADGFDLRGMVDDLETIYIDILEGQTERATGT